MLPLNAPPASGQSGGTSSGTHAPTHATGGTDPLTPAAIGAAPAAAAAALAGHLADKANPHETTAAEVGAAPAAHLTDHDNPHAVTAAQIGLGNVANKAQIPAEVGTAKGDLLLFNAPGTPDRLAIGSAGQCLVPGAAGLPVWGDAPVGGECRLTLSGANLLLSRYDGKRIIIDDAVQAIPAAGVILGTTGTTANTTYYIYCYLAGGIVMTLEAATTGYVADSRNGVMVKTGDATRSLVGMARTNAAGAWVDSVTQMFVLSWFNRRNRIVFGRLDASTNFTSPTLNAIGMLKLEFLSWGDYISASIRAMASKTFTSSQTDVLAKIMLLGNATDCYAYGTILAAVVSAWMHLTHSSPIWTPMGYNYIQLGGSTGVATANTTFSWDSCIFATIWG